MKQPDSPGVVPVIDPRRILYEGEGMIVYDKPAGLPVHFGTDHPYGLAEAMDEYARQHPGTIPVDEKRKVAPLHRLDLEASGVVILGLNRPASSAVQELFSEGLVEKVYLAVVAGPVEEEAAIEGKILSRLRSGYRKVPAHLDYRRLAGDDRLSLVEVRPREGRTHQIRALFAGINRPLAGDLRYGRPKPARQFLEKFEVPQLLLHALRLTLPAPFLGSPLTFEAPVPEDFRRVAAAKGWKVPEMSG